MEGKLREHLTIHGEFLPDTPVKGFIATDEGLHLANRCPVDHEEQSLSSPLLLGTLCVDWGELNA